MGQYHKIYNLDRKEMLHPHAFKDGLKLLEFGSSGDGTMKALAVLLAGTSGRGGGDMHTEKVVNNVSVGCWCGDRIAVVGDYYKEGDISGYKFVKSDFRDISRDVIKLFEFENEEIRQNLKYDA